MTHNICFILLAVDKENNNDPLKMWGLYLFVLAFPGECVNQLGSEVKSIPERSAGWFETLDVWHRLMLCDIKKYFFIDMKFGINQVISQTITQLPCIQLETPSSRLWNFWWIKTYTTFNLQYLFVVGAKPFLPNKMQFTSAFTVLHKYFIFLPIVYVIPKILDLNFKLLICCLIDDNVALVSIIFCLRHQMETFSALLALCAGNSPVTGELSSQRPVTRSFDFFFICAWINYNK